MKSIGRPLAVAAVIGITHATSLPAHATDIAGAGSTFVFPILTKWADAYKKATGVVINYQSVGSGAGIKQIKSKTVDFGASDAPLVPKELAASGLLQFPIDPTGALPRQPRSRERSIRCRSRHHHGERRPMSDINNSADDLTAYLIAEFRCAARWARLAADDFVCPPCFTN